MKIRKVTQDDLSELEQWFLAHKWRMPPLECLPTDGYIVDGVCAVWLYHTDSLISWMEWMVVNPEAKKRDKLKGLKALVEHVKVESKKAGMPIVFSSLQHEGLIKLYEKCGFSKTDTGMTNVVFGGS